MSSVTVRTPVEGFTGVRAGIHFVEGSAVVDEVDDGMAVAYFRRHGYRLDGETSELSAVPDGSIDSVVEWVRGGPDDQEPTEGWERRASDALDVELAKGDDARSGLVKLLSPLVSPPAED